jgi:hypothetical protein
VKSRATTQTLGFTHEILAPLISRDDVQIQHGRALLS